MKPRASPTWHPSMGLKCWRGWALPGEVGNGCTNVPRLVCHHSPTGHEWGYGGSGPADLALDICAHAFPHGCDGMEGVKLYHGLCSCVAWDLHELLKQDIIRRIPREGGEVPGRELCRWLTGNVDLEYVRYTPESDIHQAVLRLWYRVLPVSTYITDFACRFCGRSLPSAPKDEADLVGHWAKLALHRIGCSAEDPAPDSSCLIV